MSTPLYVPPLDARKMLDEGAVLIDIRQPEEFAREHIAQARLYPLGLLTTQPHQSPAPDASTVIFYCLSGMRSGKNADLLAESVAPAQAVLIDGGLNAWKKSGLSTEVNRKQPIEIMRQVQITAGALIICGVLLGFGVSSAFFLLSAFVGAGLMFAGISGYCGMAKLLMKMPWNNTTTS
ncbi:rhodanese family protein [Brenneria rubrifaciens]|uniref:DUF2892 domain-containing protein n=1 Tax=Brenneria rubrifaciens TaxID=55213 RepID=A0A4P8QPS4_9GAMM|nr:rhodanese family protein [Brenneria rubrifaciens]QCR08948.1 DUF2892 domain-containing protein [Brenneria rubrifaciens]